MDAAKISLSRRTPMLGVGIALLLVGAFAVRYRFAPKDDAYANYRLLFDTPGGWRAIPHSPQALFLYKQPKTGLLLRGAMNDIVADYNPTPDLDRDGLAHYMLDVTDENLKGWQGEMLDTVPAGGTSFRLVRRWSPGKTVVSAVAVRGNTTIMVSLSDNTMNSKAVDRAMPEFKSYLSSLQLQRHIY